MNSSHKWPVTRKIFPFDDVIKLLETRGVERTNVLYNLMWGGDIYPCLNFMDGLDHTYGPNIRHIP